MMVHGEQIIGLEVPYKDLSPEKELLNITMFVSSLAVNIIISDKASDCSPPAT